MINRDTLTEPLPAKIPIEMIEGTLYGAGRIGGGTYRVVKTNQFETDSGGAVATGTTFVSTVTFTLNPAVISNPQIMFSIYVDNDDTAAWLWPAGSSLTSSNRPRVNWGLNDVLSDPDRGIYKYSFAIKNESGGNQTYYLKVRMLYPTSAVQAVSAA